MQSVDISRRLQKFLTGPYAQSHGPVPNNFNTFLNIFNIILKLCLDITCAPFPLSLLNEFCTYYVYIYNKPGDVLMKGNSRCVRVNTVAVEKI